MYACLKKKKSSTNRNLIRSHHLLARVTLRSPQDKSSKEDSSSEAAMTLVWPLLSFRNLTARISEEDCGDADGHVLPVDPSAQRQMQPWDLFVMSDLINPQVSG